MASILETLEPTAARAALMGLIEHLTPQPYEKKPPEPTSELLRELQERAKVKPNDTSQNATAKVLRLAAQELTARILTPETEKQARDRLGDRGRLPLGTYQIQFPHAELLAHFAHRGIRTSHLSDALRHPDKFQHLQAGSGI